MAAVLGTLAPRSQQLDLGPRDCSSPAAAEGEGKLACVPEPPGFSFLSTQSTITAAFRWQDISVNMKCRALVEKLHFTVASVIASKWVSHQLWEKQVSPVALQGAAQAPQEQAAKDSNLEVDFSEKKNYFLS